MPEYSIAFSERLLDAATYVAESRFTDSDARRTVLYLSSLASEITLKALLEKAGQSLGAIKKRSHSLSGLLDDLGKCEIKAEVLPGCFHWVPASRLRGETVDKRYSDATVGVLLTGEDRGTAKYPNEVRYGDHVKDYPPKLKLAAAKTILRWAQEHWNEIRLISTASFGPA